MTATRAIFLIAIIAPSSSCDLGSGLEVGSSVNALESENSLSMNSLSMNSLSMNSLSMNSLSMNSLDNDLQDSAEGRELLKYVARCALVEGDILVVEGTGYDYEYPGLLGLAPEWEDSPLTISGQRWVSACLFAHVNAFGISVRISLRAPWVMPATKLEKQRYAVYEGAYFGNLFLEEPTLHACWADPRPDFASEPVDPSSGDRLLRVCTDDQCTIASAGACLTSCSGKEKENFTSCAGSIGDEHDEVISVWLLAADDPESVWAAHYDALYGSAGD